MSVGVIRRFAVVDIATRSTLWSTRWDVGAPKEWERQSLDAMVPTWPPINQRPGVDFFACEYNGEIAVMTTCGELAFVAAGDEAYPYCTELYLQEYVSRVLEMIVEILIHPAVLTSALFSKYLTVIAVRVQSTVVGGTVSWLPFEDSK